MHPTKVLARFIAGLSSRSQPVLLDLGPVVGTNVSFFGEELGCKIIVEDLSKDIDRHVRDGVLDQFPAFLAKRFPQESGSIDGILCWDLFDYLDKKSAQVSGRSAHSSASPGRRAAGVFRHGGAASRATGPNTRATSSWTRPTCSTGPTPRHAPSSGPCPTATSSARSSRSGSSSSSCSRPIFAKSFSESLPRRQAPHLWHHRPDAQFRSDRGAAPARAVRPRMGGSRSGAQDPRARSRAQVRSRNPAADGGARAARRVGADRVRRRRHGLHLPGPGQRGTRVRRHVASRDPVGARRAELADAAVVGNRGSEAALPRSAGTGKEDRHLRPDRAVGGKRRARHSDGGDQERRSLRADRREDVDLARRRGRQLPGVCLVRSREEEAARSVRHERVHRRAVVQGVLERDA